MATQTQNVCPFNKFGYCKHKDMCRKLHINELCENNTCDFSLCKFRHPKTCKWYWEYGRCKFNPCAFKHIENINSEENVKLESEKIMLKLRNVETALKALEEEESETKKTINQLLEMDKKIKSMEDELINQNTVINNLVKKIDNMEETLKKKEISCEKTADKIKCTLCKFDTVSENGLKIHMKRKHTEKSASEFPRLCDLCDAKFENSNDLKTHMKSHSYKLVKFRCA